MKGRAVATFQIMPCQRCNAATKQNKKYQQQPCPVCGGKGYVLVKAK